MVGDKRRPVDKLSLATCMASVRNRRHSVALLNDVAERMLSQSAAEQHVVVHQNER